MFSNDTLKITIRIKNIKSLFPFNVFMKINAATIIKTINGKCKLAKCLWPFIKKISEVPITPFKFNVPNLSISSLEEKKSEKKVNSNSLYSATIEKKMNIKKEEMIL